MVICLAPLHWNGDKSFWRRDVQVNKNAVHSSSKTIQLSKQISDAKTLQTPVQSDMTLLQLFVY